MLKDRKDDAFVSDPKCFLSPHGGATNVKEKLELFNQKGKVGN